MKTDWKAAILAVTVMVGASAIASAQDAGFVASPVSYDCAVATDCGSDTPSCGETCFDGCACDTYAGYSSCCADSCCGGGWGLFGCCEHGDQWTLFGDNCCGINIGGWVSAGYYGNFDGVNTNTANGPVAFRNVSNAPTLNQAWLYVEKEADAETYCFDLGYRVDYVYGTDGPDTQAFGYGDRFRWDNGWNSSEDYGSAIPQAYLTAAWGDWSVKVGHFYTIIGYEVVTAPDNFFQSYAYTMNYGEPFTHGGVLAEYSGIENTTVWGGYVNGWDTAFDNWEGQAMFLGGISRDLNDSTSVTWAVIAGDFGRTDNGVQNGGVVQNGDLYMNSFVLTHDFGCGWSYVFQHDLGANYNLPGGGDAYWYGVNQYLFKEINDCWAFGVRGEWFCDEDGARVGAEDPMNPGVGQGGSYYAVSLGANYKPNANLIIRPEVRFDKFDDTNAADGQGTPFLDGTDNDGQFYGVDAIFLF